MSGGRGRSGGTEPRAGRDGRRDGPGTRAYDVSVSPSPAPFRVARGLAVATVGGAVAVGGHVVAGGTPDLGVGVVAVGLAAAAGCVIASDRAWTAPRLLGALTAIQVAVHGSLWLGASGRNVDPRLAGLADAHAALASAPAHAHASAAGLTPAMLLGHAVALVLAAMLLSRTDSVVLALWELGRAVLGRRPVVRLPRRDVAAASRADLVPGVRRRARALLVSPRRGPPAVLAPC